MTAWRQRRTRSCWWTFHSRQARAAGRRGGRESGGPWPRRIIRAPICLHRQPRRRWRPRRAARCRASSAAALRGLEVAFRAQHTRLLEHARELARGGARRRRAVGGAQRRRPDRRRRRRAARRAGRGAGRHPRRPRQRLRARARHPRGPGGGVDGPRRRAVARAIDVGEVNGARASSASSASGFDSDANRIANETHLVARQPRLRLRRAARAGRLEAGAASRSRSTASAAASPATRVAVANSERLRRRHVRRARTPSSTTASSTSC